MLRSRPRVFDSPLAMYWRKISLGRIPIVISAPMLRISGNTASDLLERVRGADRLALLAEAPIQTADDLALTEQDDEPFLDIARQPREPVHLEELVRAQSIRRLVGCLHGLGHG